MFKSQQARKIPKPRIFSLKEYYDKRNTILILRKSGGLGDILVHRTIFEDFKRIMPDAKIVFACPKAFFEAVVGHPYIDEIIDQATVDTHDYYQIYDTSSACNRYEMAKAPFADKNRGDIWAEHCGVFLTKHDMHISLSEEVKKKAKQTVENYRTCPGPALLFTPVSAMLNKNLTTKQIRGVVAGLRERGFYVYSSHTQPIEILEQLGVPVIRGTIKEWMGLVWAADYVVSVDTSTAHLAGGIGKPLVAIFTFVDGKVYTKYYPTCILVQKHRDDGNWDCGPCYHWPTCPKTEANPKPCLTEITPEMILQGVDKMMATFPSPQTIL